MNRYIHYYSKLFTIYILCLPVARAADSIPVYVTEATIRSVIETIPLTGTVTSARSAALSPRVSGLVTKVNVDSGHRVTEGDILIELDTTLAKLALNRSLAVLNEARTALTEAKRLSDEAANLAKSKNIPETTVQARMADVEMKTAAVATAEAEYLHQAELVTRHTIIAPFTGVVNRKLTEIGEWVETGTPVIDLVATDQLRLDVQTPQEYFRLISENTPVIVKLDAVPGKEFTGKVFATVPVNNSNARTFLTRILVKGADGLIIPGMSAQAVFNIHLEQVALQLPRDAIIQYPDGRKTVWIVTENDGKLIVSEQQVQLGRGVSNNVIIKKGIKPGSIIVVRGNETLQENREVHILEQATADNKN